MNITKKIIDFKSKIHKNIKLVAVSKTKPNEDILEAYNTGHKIFGENKVQDLVTKYEELPKDIQWHFIGHLQSNKVKYIASFVNLIHGVDSLKLLRKINNEGVKNNKTIKCLLQMHIADETSKFGLNYKEVEELLKSEDYKKFQNIKIIGLMGMATYTTDNNKIKKEFEYLSACFKKIKNSYFENITDFKEISMGMSNDYKTAIEAGSTMVRVGSIIFGERNY